MANQEEIQEHHSEDRDWLLLVKLETTEAKMKDNAKKLLNDANDLLKYIHKSFLIKLSMEKVIQLVKNVNYIYF